MNIDMILYNGKIHTVDREKLSATAAAFSRLPCGRSDGAAFWIGLRIAAGSNDARLVSCRQDVCTEPGR